MTLNFFKNLLFIFIILIRNMINMTANQAFKHEFESNFTGFSILTVEQLEVVADPKPHPHQTQINFGASLLFHFLFLKIYATANSPTIVKTASNPGTGVGVGFTSDGGVGAKIIDVGVVNA